MMTLIRPKRTLLDCRHLKINKICQATKVKRQKILFLELTGLSYVHPNLSIILYDSFKTILENVEKMFFISYFFKLFNYESFSVFSQFLKDLWQNLNKGDFTKLKLVW